MSSLCRTPMWKYAGAGRADESAEAFSDDLSQDLSHESHLAVLRFFEGGFMPSKSINHLAVWIAAIVFFVWGYVWYNLLFKSATEAMMMQGAPAPGPTTYIIGFLMALVLGYGTAIALSKGEEPSVAHGISFGLFMGVIFYASTTLTQTLFGLVAGDRLGAHRFRPRRRDRGGHEPPLETRK